MIAGKALGTLTGGVGVPRGLSPDQDGSAVNLVAQDAPHLTYGPLVTLTRRRRDAFLVQLFHDVAYLGALPAGFEDPAHRTHVLGIRLQLVASASSVIDGDFLVAVWRFCRGVKPALGGCSQAASDAFGTPPPLKVSEAVAEFIFIWFGN